MSHAASRLNDTRRVIPQTVSSVGAASRLVERGMCAFFEASERGATPLEAQLAYEIARQPGENFKTGAALIDDINERTGANHHRGSGRRGVSELRRKGIIKKDRVMPCHKPRGARYVSAHGTTNKRFLWKHKDPISQHELSRMRKESRRMSRYFQQEAPSTAAPVRPSARHAANGALLPEGFPKLTGQTLQFYREFQAQADRALQATDDREARHAARQDAAMHDSIKRSRDPPPK